MIGKVTKSVYVEEGRCGVQDKSGTKKGREKGIKEEERRRERRERIKGSMGLDYPFMEGSSEGRCDCSKGKAVRN